MKKSFVYRVVPLWWIMRKVAVITSSRADYFLLKPLISQLQKSDNLILLASGEHLIGPGMDKIQNDQFCSVQAVECLPKDDSFLEMTKAIARGVNNFSEVFEQSQQDITLLLGDRFEIFAAATASYALKIPIAHIHGGEVTHGALDDGFRHAISKMANLHFVSHEQYRNRLLRMGEMPERVYTVGAIGLDNINISQYKDNESFFKKYSFLENKDYFLFTLHASTLCEEDIETQVAAVIQALDSFNKDFNILVTQSNRDPGGLYLNKKWTEWANQKDSIYFIPILGDDYLTAAFYSKIVIGNSSSGILEVPYLNRPVLNIGNRQEGRIIPKGVYSVGFNVDAIRLSLGKILKTYDESEQVYGTPGQISKRIYDILANTSSNNLIYKKFHDEKF
jgi:UDP-hydrolysing UDP-N-acetyl-D-glucosamine 2-epimerase